MTMTTEMTDAVEIDQARAQSLASGAAGSALLDVERALRGTGSWTAAANRVRAATAGTITAADHTGLYFGIPAICFLLHAASSDQGARFRTAVKVADQHVIAVAERRIAAALDRRAHGAALTFKDYDLFYGLSGICSLMVRSIPDNAVLPDLLTHLVRLSTPRTEDGLPVPGWWVGHDPDPILPTPGGHANLGMAHGAAGLLATLTLAIRKGIEVEGQREAIDCIIDIFDTWRQDGADGPWWPQWLTCDELRTGRTSQPAPGRLSWCYGAPGITRALQLAAIALDDTARQQQAERDLVANLNETQLARIDSAGLCHGIAGLYQTAWRMADEAITPEIADRLPALASRLTHHSENAADEDGLLTGHAGIQLALETLRHGTAPRSGWDSCLLIN